MNYATIKETDVANGPGIRVSLFVSGCNHHCAGCFNAEAWDFAYGNPYTEDTREYLLKLLSPDYIRGLSLLGGEPLDPANCTCVAKLVESVKEQYPKKDIWCYSGYTYEELLDRISQGDRDVATILQDADVLVDGRFLAEQKNLRLAFRGSENQRLIDLKATAETGVVVFYNPK